jgi:hypothetical protein
VGTVEDRDPKGHPLRTIEAWRRIEQIFAAPETEAHRKSEHTVNSSSPRTTFSESQNAFPPDRRQGFVVVKVGRCGQGTSTPRRGASSRRSAHAADALGADDKRAQEDTFGSP